MKKVIILLLLLTSLFVLLVGCGAQEEPESLEISSDVNFKVDDYQEIVTANNELGFKLLAEVEADENDNLFISPTSLLMALSMVYNGADGVTKEEIATALQVEGIDVNELNKANGSLMSLFHKDSDQIQLNVASSIWLNDKFTFQDDFVQNNKDYFNAEIQEIDISDSKSAKAINDWVKEATNKKIEEIVDDPLDSSLVVLLINAIYFKGDWMFEFDKKLTDVRTFYLDDGTTKDVSLMSLQKKLAYMENEQFQAVSLPYGDGEMSMKVFLPKENSSLEVLKQTLLHENWTLLNEEFSKKEGTIMLPRFQLEYEVVLNDILKGLGMRTAFDKGANFSKMIQEVDPLWISRVKQKTFIDVNEEGTEAAAVTSVEIVTEMMTIDEPFYLEVNRPFFIAITDDETDAILFMGAISNPQEGE